jgi:hypothetical protein
MTRASADCFGRFLQPTPEVSDRVFMDREIDFDFDIVEVERAVLSESDEGRAIASEFIDLFGDFVSNRVRPRLRQVADDDGEPQLLVNGLAELMRNVADAIEFPIGAPR